MVINDYKLLYKLKRMTSSAQVATNFSLYGNNY